MIRLALAFGLIFALALPAQARDPIPLFAAPRQMLSPPLLNEANHKLNLTNFRGKVVLLNVWATWCVPCREEMPTLDALQAQLGGEIFKWWLSRSIRRAFPPSRNSSRNTGSRI